MNAYNGVVGVFNLQGSAWDRMRRKFFVHDAQPPPLSTQASGVALGGRGCWALRRIPRQPTLWTHGPVAWC